MWFYFVWISAWFAFITTPSTKTQTDDVTTNGVCYGFNMLGSTHLFLCACVFFLYTFYTPFFSDACHHLHFFYGTFFFDVHFRVEVQTRAKNIYMGKWKICLIERNEFNVFLVDEKLLRFSILFSVCRHWCGHKKGQKNQRETEIWQIMLFK